MGNTYHPLRDQSMKLIRINEHPFECGADSFAANLLIDDRLELEGTLKLYENTGGCIYLFQEPFMMGSTALVAEAEIEKIDKDELKVKKIFYEYGYDELVHPLVDQILYFARFYGYAVGFLDLKKG